MPTCKDAVPEVASSESPSTTDVLFATAYSAPFTTTLPKELSTPLAVVAVGVDPAAPLLEAEDPEEEPPPHATSNVTVASARPAAVNRILRFIAIPHDVASIFPRACSKTLCFMRAAWAATMNHVQVQNL
jgi:hypothetical protein